jgi:prophage DNA circulation protein
MVAPLVGLAVGAAARAVAKKAATSAVKKAAAAKRTKIMADAAKKAEANKIAKTIAKKPESSVKVVKARGKSYNKVANQKEAERLARTSRPKTASSKDLRGTAKQDYEVAKVKVSDNVTARVPAKSNYEFAKDMSRFGKIQKQNAGPLKPTKAEAKANARALKSANKGTKKMENVPKDVSDRFNATVKRLAAEEAKKKGKK